MGKFRIKERRGHSNHEDDSSRRKRGITRRDHSQVKPKSNKAQKTKKTKKSTTGPSPGQQKLKVPFYKGDRVLLIGEGDFSFALSLARHHRVERIVATCYDTKEELLAKYPHANSIISTLLQSKGTQRMPNNDTAAGQTPSEESDWEGFSPEQPSTPTSTSITPFASTTTTIITKTATTIHHGINATKLSTTHKKILRPDSPFTKIVFNFPHVGGLSTDVNRQVRSNQELLVGFFNAAKALLASNTNPVTATRKQNTTNDNDEDDEEEDDEDDEEEDDEAFNLETGSPIPRLQPLTSPPAAAAGQILVTLFEGEPYTLWNVRDLARHCGLKVVESFRFPWSAYPGYRHARTVGEIVTSGSGRDRGVEKEEGREDEEEGKRKRGKGAWRGEEREARCYVLEVKGGVGEVMMAGVVAVPESASASGGNVTVLGKRKERGRRRDDDDDEDEGSDSY